MVTDAAYYSQVLEDLDTALSGLDTTGYQWGPEDRWVQARHWDPSKTTRNLEWWCDIGGSDSLTQSHVNHNAEIHISLRYQDDNDSTSQGRMHGAVRAALDLLTYWRADSGVRSMPTGFTFSGVEGRPGWVICVLSMILQFPRQIAGAP